MTCHVCHHVPTTFRKWWSFRLEQNLSPTLLTLISVLMWKQGPSLWLWSTAIGDSVGGWQWCGNTLVALSHLTHMSLLWSRSTRQLIVTSAGAKSEALFSGFDWCIEVEARTPLQSTAMGDSVVAWQGWVNTLIALSYLSHVSFASEAPSNGNDGCFGPTS